ncbi:hypothetical protein FRB99_008992 [Tulasnella sp. 403]|nr:hypothetical protein FRB99_008992 [Tulasnella sp. 403]
MAGGLAIRYACVRYAAPLNPQPEFKSLGINIVLFFACFWILWSRPINGARPRVMLSCITVMFILNTLHLAGTLRALDEAFFYYDGKGGSDGYFGNRKTFLNLSVKSIYGVVLLIGDGLLIYRCWIIWAKNYWVIVAPSVLLVGTAITGWYLVYDLSQLQPGSTVFVGQVKVMTPLTFSLSLVTNLLTTSLMIWRITIFSRLSQRSGQSVGTAYRRTLAVVVESGALVPVFLVLSLAFYIAGMEEQTLLTGPMSQVIGIIPTMTLLQVRLGYSQYESRHTRGSMNAATDDRTQIGTSMTSKSGNRPRVQSAVLEAANVPCLKRASTVSVAAQAEPSGSMDKFDYDIEGQDIEMRGASTFTTPEPATGMGCQPMDRTPSETSSVVMASATTHVATVVPVHTLPPRPLPPSHPPPSYPREFLSHRGLTSPHPPPTVPPPPLPRPTSAIPSIEMRDAEDDRDSHIIIIDEPMTNGDHPTQSLIPPRPLSSSSKASSIYNSLHENSQLAAHRHFRDTLLSDFTDDRSDVRVEAAELARPESGLAISLPRSQSRLAAGPAGASAESLILNEYGVNGRPAL